MPNTESEMTLVRNLNKTGWKLMSDGTLARRKVGWDSGGEGLGWCGCDGECFIVKVLCGGGFGCFFGFGKIVLVVVE